MAHGLDNAEWRFLCAGIEMTHRASVSYQDSKGENYKNPAILDWNTFAPMTRFPAKTVHDIAVELKNKTSTWMICGFASRKLFPPTVACGSLGSFQTRRRAMKQSERLYGR